MHTMADVIIDTPSQKKINRYVSLSERRARLEEELEEVCTQHEKLQYEVARVPDKALSKLLSANYEGGPMVGVHQGEPILAFINFAEHSIILRMWKWCFYALKKTFEEESVAYKHVNRNHRAPFGQIVSVMVDLEKRDDLLRLVIPRASNQAEKIDEVVKM